MEDKNKTKVGRVEGGEEKVTCKWERRGARSDKSGKNRIHY